MDEALIRRFFAYNLAHRSVLHAIIASHPDPAFLVKSIHQHSESVKVALLNFPFSDVYLEKYEEELKHILRVAEKHAKK